MSSEIIIGGVTFPAALAKALPTIPGLSTLLFLGSGFDGINTNRIAGGPALITPAAYNAPTVSSNYATFGATGTIATATAHETAGSVDSVTLTQGGTRYVAVPTVNITGGGGSGASVTGQIGGGAVTGFTGLVGGINFTSNPNVSFVGGNLAAQDTQNARNSTILAAGWSVLAVARGSTISGVPSFISDERDGSSSAGVSVGMEFLVTGGNPTLRSLGGAPTSDVTLPSAVSNWRCVAYNYTGGAAGQLTSYSLTDNLAGTPATLASLTANNFSPHLGAGNGNGTAQTADIAAFMVINQSTSLVTLQAIYASIKTLMARRGIVC